MYVDKQSICDIRSLPFIQVTRTFCTVCGSSISHKSAAFGDATAVQTGNLHHYFKDLKVSAEFFTKNRWSAFGPISGALQKETM